MHPIYEEQQYKPVYEQNEEYDESALKQREDQ